MRDTGIAAATSGLAGVRVVRCMSPDVVRTRPTDHGGELLFYFVLEGTLGVDVATLGNEVLRRSDSCAIPAGSESVLSLGPGAELLEVALPASMPRE
jgi:hypothetical protein